MAEDRVQQANRKEAVTDGVIRQLIDQIAQLQRASDAHDLHHVLLPLQPAVNQRICLLTPCYVSTATVNYTSGELATVISY